MGGGNAKLTHYNVEVVVKLWGWIQVNHFVSWWLIWKRSCTRYMVIHIRKKIRLVPEILWCKPPGSCGELIAQYRPFMSFWFYPTLYLSYYLYFRILTVLEKRQKRHLSPRESASNQHNLSWRHNIYLWRHNVARRHARGKQNEHSYFDIVPKPPVYIDPKMLLIYYVTQFIFVSSDITFNFCIFPNFKR